MKRILIGILAFAMCCMCFPVGSAARAENGVSILDENAFAAYALCDFASGQIIASKNGDTVCQNVGLSQMMSLLLFFDALEKGNSNSKKKSRSASMRLPRQARKCFWIRAGTIR